jgi:DNA repair exonuclease SbcCD ATPase subunit
MKSTVTLNLFHQKSCFCCSLIMSGSQDWDPYLLFRIRNNGRCESAIKDSKNQRLCGNSILAANLDEKRKALQVLMDVPIEKIQEEDLLEAARYSMCHAHARSEFIEDLTNRWKGIAEMTVKARHEKSKTLRLKIDLWAHKIWRSSLQQQVTSCNHRIAELQVESDMAAKEAKSQAEALSKLNQKHDELGQELSKAERSITEMNAALDGRSECIKQLEHSNEQQRERISQLHEAVQTRGKAQSALREDINALEKTNKEQEIALNDLQKQKNDLKVEKDVLQGELQKTAQQLQDAQAAASESEKSHKAKLDETAEELKQLRVDNKKQMSELEAKRKALAETEAEYKDLLVVSAQKDAALQEKKSWIRKFLDKHVDVNEKEGTIKFNLPFRPQPAQVDAAQPGPSAAADVNKCIHCHALIEAEASEIDVEAT